MKHCPNAKRTLILGAAGRDFHNFNMVYRDDPTTRVLAFSAAQIPNIAGRTYPPALSGPLYPDGIPIFPESELDDYCQKNQIEQVIFAYSDVAYGDVMHKASLVQGHGADFCLLGPARTMLRSRVPVIATSAVRTGCGKSQVTRWMSGLIQRHGLRVAVVRHPMPYGDLERQAVQRFATPADLYAADCTVEEREEYEPHLAIGNIVFAGIDYACILAEAEREADLILWDGGNNDFPFFRPDFHVVLVDPLRPGHETMYYPGETVLRMADIVIVAKANSAPEKDIQTVIRNARAVNAHAPIVRGASSVRAETPEALRGKRLLVIEDGPTVTHGGMPYGAGFVAAIEAGAREIVDPRPAAAPEIAAVYELYPHINRVLPAMGYGKEQLRALQETINNSDADIAISATPCDLSKLITVEKPVVRVRYDYDDLGEPPLSAFIEAFLKSQINPKT